MSESDRNMRLSFDEFKLYYESTEKVTDRRLETNRWNYSICIATLVAIAAINQLEPYQLHANMGRSGG
jgi:hypothetical protein